MLSLTSTPKLSSSSVVSDRLVPNKSKLLCYDYLSTCPYFFIPLNFNPFLLLRSSRLSSSFYIRSLFLYVLMMLPNFLSSVNFMWNVLIFVSNNLGIRSCFYFPHQRANCWLRLLADIKTMAWFWFEKCYAPSPKLRYLPCYVWPHVLWNKAFWSYTCSWRPRRSLFPSCCFPENFHGKVGM